MTEKSIKRNSIGQQRSCKNAHKDREVYKTQKGKNMELKTLLGDKIKDDMSVEEILKLDVDFVPKSATDGLVSKEVFDKATKDASDWKKKYKATLDDATRQQEENAEKQEAMEKELADFKRDKSISELTTNYVSLGYSADLAKSSAIAQLDNDNATLFKNMQLFQDGKMAELNDLKQKNTPNPSVNNANKPQEVKLDEMSSYEMIAYQQKLAEENGQEN